MATRSVCATVRAGRLESLEAVPFPEGAELTVTGEVPEPTTTAQPAANLSTGNLGVKTPITRDDIYDEIG